MFNRFRSRHQPHLMTLTSTGSLGKASGNAAFIYVVGSTPSLERAIIRDGAFLRRETDRLRTDSNGPSGSAKGSKCGVALRRQWRQPTNLFKQCRRRLAATPGILHRSKQSVH